MNVYVLACLQMWKGLDVGFTIASRGPQRLFALIYFFLFIFVQIKVQVFEQQYIVDTGCRT